MDSSVGGVVIVRSVVAMGTLAVMKCGQGVGERSVWVTFSRPSGDWSRLSCSRASSRGSRGSSRDCSSAPHEEPLTTPPGSQIELDLIFLHGTLG